MIVSEQDNNSNISMFVESFNKVSTLYGQDFNSVMAEVAIEILSLRDTFNGKNLSFFDKGALLLSTEPFPPPNQLSNEEIKACMFWWVFNEELMERQVEMLIKCG